MERDDAADRRSKQPERKNRKLAHTIQYYRVPFAVLSRLPDLASRLDYVSQTEAQSMDISWFVLETRYINLGCQFQSAGHFGRGSGPEFQVEEGKQEPGELMMGG